MIKRSFDLFLSLFCLISLFPLFALIVVIVKLDSKGPAFFKQARVGKNRHLFKIYKFRTMVQNAEAIGCKITTANDKRLTRSGKILRKWKLDEIPQLINVLKGDMSFVGPRPEVLEYSSIYPEQSLIYSVRPGITDPASIRYRHENEILGSVDDPAQKYIKEILPEKIKLNLQYIENSGMINDLRIILETLRCL